MQQPKKRSAIRGNQFEEVKDSEIDYELPSGNAFFGSHTNLVPLMQNSASPRVFYGARFFNQAVPLTNPEAPLVQSAIDGDPDGRTFEDWAGDHSGNVRAKDDAIIKKVTKNGILVANSDGSENEYDLYDKQPFNRKTMFTNIALVKPGDKVKKGQLLAKSNYTSDKGELALGANALIGMVPYKGITMDDAIVISQDFAKRLTSEQVLGYDHEKKGDIKTGLNHFVTMFPQKYTKEQMANIEENGVVKPGTVLQKGDPIILGTAPRIISSGSQQLGKLSRHMLASRKDATQTWDYDNPGEVLDVVETNAGIKLNIRSELPAQVGDKIVIRNGQKGIISEIIPQEHMPRKMDGTPLEVLLNPLGLPSRVNSSSLYEMLLGKIAAKTGVPYKLSQFNKLGDKTYDFVQSELDKNGLTDKEEIFDPKENRKLDNPVSVGNANILKLYHIAENKMSSRAFGAYDTTAQQPLKGGDEAAGSKRISGLETTALMGAGAYNILKEVSTIRGTRNDDYWRQVRMGQSPNAPREPFAWNKFKALIIGAGFHADEIDKDKLRLAPMTDAKLKKLGPLEVENGGILDFKDMSPEKGGLFDHTLTSTNKWGVIPLDFKIPNPAFETHIQKLLGLTKKELLGILSGNEEYGGLKGPKAIEKALNELDLDKLKEESIEAIKKKQVSKRPLATQRLQYIAGMEKNGITPQDLLIQNVPVIPAKFRPFSIAGDTFISGDANELYKDLINVRNSYRETKAELGDDGAKENILHVYDAAKAVYGYGDPINAKSQERGVSGFLSKLTGDSPKFSWLNRKLLSKTVDLSGRAVITVDPELKMDEIAIPEEMGWKILQPFVQKRLVNKGLTPAQALIAVRDQTPIAKTALYLEAKERPVMYSRAPVWHKFGTLAGYAKLIPGKNIAINSFVGTGLNADHDGDENLNQLLVLTSEETFFKLGLNKLFNPIKDYMIRDKNIVVKQGEVVFTCDMHDFPKGKYFKSTFPEKGQIDWYDVDPSIKVMSYDETTKETTWAVVSVWSEHKDREIEIVDLTNDYQIITDDDPRAVYGTKAGEITLQRFTPTAAKANNVLVPRVKTLLNDSIISNDTFVCDPEIVKQSIKNDAYQLKEEFKLNANTGYLFGALVGDGWVSKSTKTSAEGHKYDSIHGVCFANQVDTIADKLTHIINTEFLKTGEIEYTKYTRPVEEGYGECNTYTFKFASFGRLIRNFIGGERDENTSGAANKHLPTFYFTTPKEFRLGLLAGLMDTDGSISTSNGKKKPQLIANYSSMSIRLVLEVKLLAMTLGINSRITPFKTPLGKTCWLVSFSNKDIQKWNGQYMNMQHKVEHITNAETIEDSAVLAKYDIVPITKILAIKLKHLIGCPKITKAMREDSNLDLTDKKYKQNLYQILVQASTESHAKYGAISRISAKNIIEYIGIERLLKLDGNNKQWADIVNNSEITWERVIDVQYTKQKETGYDLTVPGYETFMSVDGIILSNTINVHALITPDAIKDAKEKLMPSKMLFGIRDEDQIMNGIKQESLLGLYLAKHSKAKNLHTFPSMKLALEAIKAGKVSLSDEINISS